MSLKINHSQNENWIKESRIPHTFLRNSWYVDLNEDLLKSTKKLEFSVIQQIKTEPHRPGASSGLRREYAETGAKVILRDNNPEVLNLARKAVTFLELAKILEQVLGKKI